MIHQIIVMRDGEKVLDEREDLAREQVVERALAALLAAVRERGGCLRLQVSGPAVNLSGTLDAPVGASPFKRDQPTTPHPKRKAKR